MPYGVLCERAPRGAVVAGKTEYLATAIQRLMTSSDHNNDLVTSQEKLEWVTPKISLMDAEDTCGLGGKLRYGHEGTYGESLGTS